MAEFEAVGPAFALDGPPPVAPPHSLLNLEGVVVERDATRVLNGVNVWAYPTGCSELWEFAARPHVVCSREPVRRRRRPLRLRERGRLRERLVGGRRGLGRSAVVHPHHKAVRRPVFLRSGGGSRHPAVRRPRCPFSVISRCSTSTPTMTSSGQRGFRCLRR